MAQMKEVSSLQLLFLWLSVDSDYSLVFSIAMGLMIAAMAFSFALPLHISKFLLV